MAEFTSGDQQPAVLARSHNSQPAVQAISDGFGEGVRAISHNVDTVSASAFGAGAIAAVRADAASVDGGIGVDAFGQGVGVKGGSNAGVAVRGDSTSGIGVFGRSPNNDGIHGRSASPEHAGVSAVNETNGFGLFAESRGGLAGIFVGSVRVQGNLEVTGAITVDGDVLLRNRDLAEQFGAVSECAPGSVMVIGENALLQPCTREYDRRAVGIISGAGPLHPAITLGHAENGMPTASIAMVGTAFCLVDADKAPIEAGDLLTSSSTPGHAMKASDPIKSFGAIIGKALGSLLDGCGLIPVVVTLQ